MSFLSKLFGNQEPEDFLGEEEDTGVHEVEPRGNQKDGSLRVLTAKMGGAAVTISHPQSTKDVLKLQEALKRGNIIIVDLSGLDPQRGQGIYNFLCGACVHGDGDYRSVGSDVHVFTPKGCDVEEIEGTPEQTQMEEPVAGYQRGGRGGR